MQGILLFWMIVGLAAADPPTVPQPTPPPAATVPTVQWHGWMIVDVTNHKIVFLTAERTLNLQEGVVVEGVPNLVGSYTYSVPSAYRSAFTVIIIDRLGNVSAIKPVSPQCLLAYQPAGIPDEHDGRHARVATAFGVTGPLLRAYSAPSVPMVYVGTCAPVDQ